MSFRIKLKKQSEKILVEESQKRVECLRTYLLELIGFPLSDNIVNRIIKRRFGLHPAHIVNSNIMKIRFETKGTAMCVEPDVFNEKKGIRIAAIKANQKAYSKAVRILIQLKNKLKDVEQAVEYNENSLAERLQYLERRKQMIIKDEC